MSSKSVCSSFEVQAIPSRSMELAAASTTAWIFAAPLRTSCASFFFRGDSDDAISFASASESSKTRSLSFLPAATAALNSETLSTGMENEWFFPPRVYWRLW